MTVTDHALRIGQGGEKMSGTVLSRTGIMFALALISLALSPAHIWAGDTAVDGSDSAGIGDTAKITWAAILAEPELWHTVTSAGNVVIANKKAMLSLDPADGKIIWENERFNKISKDCYEPVEGTPFAVINVDSWDALDYQGSSAVLINTCTGDIVWESYSYGLNSTDGHIVIRDLGLILLYGETFTKPKKRAVIAVDIKTGKRIWENDEFFGNQKPRQEQLVNEKGDNGRKTISANYRPVWISDSMMALFVTYDGPMAFNPYTGKIVGRVTARPQKTIPPEADAADRHRNYAVGQTSYVVGEYAACVPAPATSDAPPYVDLEDSVLYMAFDNTLSAIRLSDFSHRWTVLPVIIPDGTVSQIQKTSYGVLIDITKGIQGDAMALIDSRDGKIIWSFRQKARRLTNFQVIGDQAYVLSNNSFCRIDIPTGRDTILCDTVKFNGGEKALRLERHEKGFLAFSAQNMIIIDSQGTIFQHYYSKAGKMGTIAQIATGVLAGAVLVGAVYALSNDFYNDQPAYFVPRGLFENNHQRATGEYEQKPQIPEFLYIPVDIKINDDTKPGVAKISKKSCTPVTQVVLKKRNDTYLIDWQRDRFFLFKNARTVLCYRF
jgi:hypothetical protein